MVHPVQSILRWTAVFKSQHTYSRLASKIRSKRYASYKNPFAPFIMDEWVKARIVFSPTDDSYPKKKSRCESSCFHDIHLPPRFSRNASRHVWLTRKRKLLPSRSDYIGCSCEWSNCNDMLPVCTLALRNFTKLTKKKKFPLGRAQADNDVSLQSWSLTPSLLWLWQSQRKRGGKKILHNLQRISQAVDTMVINAVIKCCYSCHICMIYICAYNWFDRKWNMWSLGFQWDYQKRDILTGQFPWPIMLRQY